MQGTGYGQLKEPNGIAIDRDGNIYVADAGNHLVLKLGPDGSVIAQWSGPDPGFYAPRDIAIGPDNAIYVLDQGHSRIVKMAQLKSRLRIVGASIFEPLPCGITPGWNEAEPCFRWQHGHENGVDPAVLRNDLVAVEGKFHGPDLT